MTPQEIAEYKQKWRITSWDTFIDPDADVFAKNWAKRNLQKHQWSFDKYAREDDWHCMRFENMPDMTAFKEAYEEWKAR